MSIVIVNDKYEREWGYINPIAAAYWRMRDETVFESKLNNFGSSEGELRVLEVGVGHGHELAKFWQLGISQSHLVGIDLVFHRLPRAKIRISQPRFIAPRFESTRLCE